jgi:hypothetical protein
MSIITIMALKIIDIIRIIDIIAVNFIRLPPAHSSGIWLQILGLTGGMHSYTSEASIAAKILRIPVGQCTSVLADTRLKQAFSTVFDSPQQHNRDTTEPHLRPND